MATGDLMRGGAHSLRNEPFHVGVDGAVVLGNDVPAWLRSPGSSSDFRVEQVGSRSEVGRPNQLLFLLGQIARCWVLLASISFCSPLVSPHFVFDRAGQQHISWVNSRLFGAWSFAGFCCFCCFLPKNKSAGRPSEPDYLKDWKMRIMLRNVLSCNAVAIFWDLHRRVVGKCA